jgi:glycerol-3-phosphate dehydrogenase subunit C
MLRAKAVRFRKDGRVSRRDKLLTSTDPVGRLAGIPVVAEASTPQPQQGGRKLLESVLGVHRRRAGARSTTARPLRKRLEGRAGDRPRPPRPPGHARQGGAVRHLLRQPQPAADGRGPGGGVRAQRHPRAPGDTEKCCGMPKLELGDLEAVEKYQGGNIPELARAGRRGLGHRRPVPSCVLMFKQELPLMFPDDEDVKKVAAPCSTRSNT